MTTTDAGLTSLVTQLGRARASAMDELIASAVDDEGRALAPHYLGWDASVPIRQLIRNALDAAGLHLPVVVRNDADCAALAW